MVLKLYIMLFQFISYRFVVEFSNMVNQHTLAENAEWIKLVYYVLNASRIQNIDTINIKWEHLVEEAAVIVVM